MKKRLSYGFLFAGAAWLCLAGVALGASPAPKPLAAQATGTPAGPYVALSWIASPSASAVTGLTYTVLRAAGLCGATGQAFAPLSGAAGITGTAFEDTAVVPGGQYSYETVAVAPDGVESAPTNCADATIPIEPPSGETAAGHGAGGQ